jgi:hypothetical protein
MISFRVIFFALPFLFSCGGEIRNRDRAIVQLEMAEDFSTRLGPELLIAGERCEGSEFVVAGGRRVACERDQWLITIDNVNQCNPQGLCTNFAVQPIIAEREMIDILTVEQYTFYRFNPVSPISEERRRVLHDHLVRYDQQGGVQVVEKN